MYNVLFTMYLCFTCMVILPSSLFILHSSLFTPCNFPPSPRGGPGWGFHTFMYFLHQRRVSSSSFIDGPACIARLSMSHRK